VKSPVNVESPVEVRSSKTVSLLTDDLFTGTLYISGLKIVGGRRTEAGQFGAFITKVKKGSIADTVGHLRRGQYLYNIVVLN